MHVRSRQTPTGRVLAGIVAGTGPAGTVAGMREMPAGSPSLTSPSHTSPSHTEDEPVLHQVHDVAWAPSPNRVRVLAGQGVPAAFTSAFCFITRTHAGTPQVLLVDGATRGLDLPGGHREDGEDLLDTVRRELAEETGLHLPADVPVRVLGRVHLHVLGPAPDGYRYPHPDSFMIATHVELPAGAHVRGTSVPEEIAGVSWVDLAQVPAQAAGRVWLPLLDLLAADLSACGSG